MKKYWEAGLILLILFVSAYLRLYQIADYMTFLGDEGRDVLVVKRILVDHKLTLLGTTASVGGFFLGPIYYYFMLPFLWLWRLDPVGPAVMVAIFGIATVYLVYKLGRELFSPAVGLTAASLYSFSPLVIAYSRSSWNPNLVPFFATLLIYLLWKIKEKGQFSLLLITGVVLGIGLQLHYLFLFLFAVTFIWIFLLRRTKPVARTILGLLGGFLLGYAPFLAFELRHNFPNTISIVRFLLAGKETGVSGNYLSTLWEVLYRLFGRLVFRFPQPEAWHRFTLWQQLLWQITIITSIGVSLWLTLKGIFAKKKSAPTLLLIWLGATLLLFGFYKKAIYDYYFGIIFPIPFICLGLIIWRMWEAKIFRWFSLVLFVGLLWFNWQGRPFRFPPNRQLDQAKLIAKSAFEKTDNQPFNFALAADFNSDHAYRYFFEIWGNPPVTIENYEKDPDRKTVTDQLIVICEKPDCQPLGHPLWEIAGFGRAEIVDSWQVSFVKIYKLAHYDETN